LSRDMYKIYEVVLLIYVSRGWCLSGISYRADAHVKRVKALF